MCGLFFFFALVCLLVPVFSAFCGLFVDQVSCGMILVAGYVSIHRCERFLDVWVGVWFVAWSW